MTLDEAIKNEEEIAIQQIEKANALDNIPLFGMSEDDIEEIKECYKCSKEHRQLAEWLKELKQLREQTRWIPVSEKLPNISDFSGSRVWERKVLITGYLSFDDKKELFISEVFAEEVILDRVLNTVIVAWMPLPKLYKQEVKE